MEKELKAAIKGLEKENLIYSELWKRLVMELIGWYELSGNIEAVNFWTNR